MKCLYCNKDKTAEELSPEHIIPKRIGGNIKQNPLIINNVCERCNNLAGMFIDEPFIKSFFIYSSMVLNMYKYANIRASPSLPCAYLGKTDTTVWENKICEYWLGPSGDSIFHFHEKIPDEIDGLSFVGIPSAAKKYIFDKGFVFLFIRATNPEWHGCIINSVINQFESIPIYLGNGPKPQIDQFYRIPEKLINLHECLKSGHKEKQKSMITISAVSSDRFLAKIALGLGSKLLGSEYDQSRSAELLRTFMWQNNPEKRESIPLSGFGISSFELKDVTNLLSWGNGHAFIIMPIQSKLMLCVFFYGNQAGMVQISDEYSLWQGIIDEEIVFLLAPGIQKCIGPIKLINYLSHISKNDYKNIEISNLEEELNRYEIPPPIHLSDK